jgi:hypothetical protein
MDEHYLELLIDGYTIIPDVLSPQEVEEARGLFYDWKSTIPNHDEIHEQINPHGIYKFHEAGHQRHAWFIRTRPKVQAMFKYLYDTDDLVSSFDGSCFISSTCTRMDKKPWTHTDQAPNVEGFRCYQSFVSLTNNKHRTLVVYEGTHDYHHQYFQERDMLGETKNWQLINHDTLGELEGKKRVLEVPAGALVIWDSRVFHQNQYGYTNSQTSPPGEERIVQYVCFLPRGDRKNTQSQKTKRRKYFDDRRTTSHWPYPIHVNGLQPQTYGNARLVVPYGELIPPDLTGLEEEIEKLI